MAAWASLSGYLYFKPGGGALNRLKGRRRLWCVLDESRGQLLYHKSEEEARCKPPMGHVELRGAAISLDLDNQNQFVIIVDGKEVYLTAENHESMMIWLMALQSKRDLFAKYEGTDNINTSVRDGSSDSAASSRWVRGVGWCGEEEQRERVGGLKGRDGRPSLPQLYYHPPLTATASSMLPGQPLPGQPAAALQQQQQQQQQQPRAIRQRHYSTSSSDVSVVREGAGHKVLCSSKSLQQQLYSNNVNNNVNNNTNNQRNSDCGGLPAQLRRQQLMRLGGTVDGSCSRGPMEKTDRSRSLPPVFEEATGVALHPFSRKLSVSMEGTELTQRSLHPHPAQHSSSLFANSSHGTNINFAVPSHLSACLLESSSSASTVDSDDVTADDCRQGKERDRHVSDNGVLQSRGSSLSASSDSAIDKGDNCDYAARVQELEKDLISSKCQLAKAMNRQACFQEILKQKDEIILDLDEKLGKLGGADVAYDSKRRANQATKEFQERIRILQNQNRFLNEEVRRLARLRSQELLKIKEHEGRVVSLEADIEVWKLQYVSLIQSSIRFTGTDTMDDAELSLYGGDRHKNKVRSLLEEARKVNPSLPTFENLSAGEVHVDYHGFKHQFQDCGLLLHYLCQELTQHYLAQAAAQENHQRRWHNYLKNNAKNIMKNRKELKELCRAGVPDQHRRQVWRTFIHDKVADLMLEKGPHYFRSLCSMLPDSPLAARYRKQISLDLMRTMPSNVKFSTQGSKGIMDLQDVLLAFCIHNPNVGYCQGMNFLVAMALLFMDAQDAFWTLVAVTERYHTASYFDQNLLGAQADQSVLRDLLADRLPDLARHLQAIDIEISTVTLNWFLAIFFDAVPFPTLLRVWDCFLLEGPKVLFRFSLAILKLHEREILNKTETISVMRHLKACARVTYDVEGLVQLAFRGLKPFPRRQDISSKQTVYLKALKEKYRWRELQKLAFAERENLFLSLESETGSNSLTFECCTVTASGEVWVCYGNQSECKVCIVDCKEGTMTDQPIQFSSRVMVLCTVPGAILFGTLSWNIFCFKTSDRTQAWEQQLHDAVLSLCQYQDGTATRVFAGLADGTVAVLEDVSPQTSFYDVMYIMIGQSPVTCLRLVDSHLWCACGNTVSIIHASTLDALDSFTVSSNPYDHILALQPGLPGVWISVRGSSILELWDPATLCCKMLYDTRAGRYPNLRKDDEVYFNRSRITSILPLDYSVWVGTGEGNLITYDVFTHQGSKTPSDSSSFVGSYTDSFSALVGKEESASLPGYEGFDPVREAAMRVRQLYLSQQDGEEETMKMSRLAVSTPSTTVNNSCESVSRDHAGYDHNTSAGCQPGSATADGHNGPEDGERRRYPKGDRMSREVDQLTPRVMSPGEESEGITPTASFCTSSADVSQSELVEKASSQENLVPRTSKGGRVVTCTPTKPDSEREVGRCEDVTKTSDEAVTGHNSGNSTSASHREKWTLQDGDGQRPKSTSPRNGMHRFYIGEEGESLVRKTLSNHSVPAQTLSHSGQVASEPCTSDSALKGEVSSSVEEAKNLPDDVAAGRETVPDGQLAADSFRDCPVSAGVGELPGQVGQGQQGQRQVREPEVAVSGSEGSVIMQVWETITGPLKARRSSGEPQPACQTAGSQGSQPASSQGSQSASSQPASQTADSQGSQGSQPACQTTGSQGSQQDGADAVGRRADMLKTSVGSSLTSSLDSRQSESDEVFQDASDDVIMSTEDGATTTANTTLEESQCETGHNDPVSRDASYHSLVDMDSGPGASSDQGKRTVKKKRPQSLFVSRGSKSQKPSGVSVDKHEPLSRGKFVVGSPPTPTRLSSQGTSDSSLNTQDSCQSPDNLQPADREAQYRLDYTNLHIDTDMDSVCTDLSFDSRRSSSICSLGRFDTELKVKSEEWQEDEAGSSEGGDVGLGMLDCDPTSFIFPQDMYNMRDGSGPVGRAMMDGGMSQLLNTPAVSLLSCHTWSSYDEVSTPSVASYAESARLGRHHRNGVVSGGLPRNNSTLSTATSIASTTDLLYAADMTLMSKNKISDKPVKCLLVYMQEGKPLVLSFSGCHSDDEAVLKWSREKDEMLWTNDPILEYNPATKTTKLPSYMKARLSSSSSSTHSLKQRLSQGSQ